jgi:hypothetical protein
MLGHYFTFYKKIASTEVAYALYFEIFLYTTFQNFTISGPQGHSRLRSLHDRHIDG